MVYLEHAFDAAEVRPLLAGSGARDHDPVGARPDAGPAGKHVLSAVVLYAPFDERASGDAARRELHDACIGVLERHAPGLRRQVVASELLLPADLEREYRLTGGHWHHGELALDQFMMLRPVPGAAQYAMPVGGLFLCGAGCHPGGGVMGSAGRNAAKAVLATERAA
jgi:phytoene dehydrogenase-like protein